MDTEVMTMGKIHHGHNVRRFRQIQGYSQETFAEKLKMTQSALSRYEQKESIDFEVLEKMANILKLPIEVLRDFSEDAAMNIIANTFTDNDVVGGGMNNGTFTFNPVEKIIESYIEKEKLLNDKVELLEQMLSSEREKVAILQKMLDSKK